MCADLLALLAVFEESLAIDARGLEVTSKLCREALFTEALAGLVDEEGIGTRERCAGLGFADGKPRPERAHDVGPEGPRPRIVRLVLVEGEHAAAEIGVHHVERARL